MELAARTGELETLGHVHASCTSRPGFRPLEGELLSDLDCSAERLVWALRESASNAGGEALVGLLCGSRRFGRIASESFVISCSADVARFSQVPLSSRGPLAPPRAAPPETPAPSAGDVRRIDEPDASLAFRIVLSFQPTTPAVQRPARAASRVQELPRLPIADCALGDLAASCEDGCDERALRYGVLIAAGRMGVPDVVAVRCFGTAAGNACVGTLAAPAVSE